MITLAGICQKRNYTNDWGENDVFYKQSTDFARHRDSWQIVKSATVILDGINHSEDEQIYF